MDRRNFIELGGAVILLGGLQSNPQLEQITAEDAPDSDIDLYGLVLGTNRPDPRVVDQRYDTYRLLHINPRTGVRTKLTHTQQAWQEVPMPIPTNQLDEVETQSAITFFNHTFARPEAPDTKNWNFTAADLTKFSSELELAATTKLETTQRGNYPPGAEATPGVALRFTGTPTGGEGVGGYASQNNGIVVGEDDRDSFVRILKDGTTKTVYRNEWNGFQPDQRVWVNNRPVITRLPHLFYGGGDLTINIVYHKENNSTLKRLHTFTPDNVDDAFGDGPPIEQPNLPVRFETTNLAGGNLRANACHYSYALSEAENRVNGEHFGPITVSDTGWTALLGWRKRTGWDAVNVKPLTISAAAETNDVMLDLQLDATVTNETTTLPKNTTSSETAVNLVDGDFTADGERRWPGFVPSGQGSSSDAISADNLTFNLAADKTVVLFAQGMGGSANVSGVVKWEEFF